MIIAFAGRKNSGKTTLANLGVELGYKKLSFQMIFEELARLIIGDATEKVTLNKEHFKTLSKESGVKIEAASHIGKSINVEELPSFLRYEVFWPIDKRWGALKFKEKFHESLQNEDCVIDDVKNHEEKEIINDYDNVTFFVARTYDFSFKNSEIETELRTRDFDDFVFNREKDSTKRLVEKFKVFLRTMKAETFFVKKKHEGRFKTRLDFRNFLKQNSHLEHKSVAAMLGVSEGTLSSYYCSYKIDSRRQKYSIDTHSFSIFDSETAYFAGVFCADGCLKTSVRTNMVSAKLQMVDLCLIEKFRSFLKSNYKITQEARKSEKHKILFGMEAQSPTIVENLKLWNMRPRKSTKEEIPFPVVEDKELFKPWLVGMIDGDGHVALNNRSLEIGLICSNSAADYILEQIPLEFRFARSLITTKNGFSMSRLSIACHRAVDFYNWLGKPTYGLERKWKNVEKFKLLNTKRRTLKNKFSSPSLVWGE